ncbi:MAG TPA: hypothetical protein DER33_01695, partial [Syntrophomonas sp.]|nr:hypothetical protein [Syntrophomonas sp.]
YYYLYNGHGDVIQVIDEAGNTVNSYSYDEWGNILSSQEQIANPMKYAGEYYDEETGLYYLRARYYDPTIGRFISRDSVEGDITNPLSLNSFTYCTGNPLFYQDPSGLFTVPSWLSNAANSVSNTWNNSAALVKEQMQRASNFIENIQWGSRLGSPANSRRCWRGHVWCITCRSRYRRGAGNRFSIPFSCPCRCIHWSGWCFKFRRRIIKSLERFCGNQQ